ncbi:hypothetical protein [Secundilactobacillus collinoides]|uniref:Mga helix-turn-helix domain-containing protein n=2 Tax=Secundilactobacillus collinoides TaxID=33960 RepID=A0A0R2BJD9_SECCO|nr:hypothetical protein [Secundilactobacillus collinoides]KRM76329.1 hypothetical protein FC82_GL001689 [Secundilactobacillus collinoides DSM 20515 = JCM 1123]KZL41765.1 hypothetical protein TY91_05480 [Secundilactobacillus collinoides]
MDYLAFLEKDDQLKLKLVWLLETSHENRISLKDVFSRLSVTRYKLNKVIASLQLDLQTGEGLGQSSITIKDGVLFGEQITFSVFRTLQLSLLRQSLRFQIFEYEYMAKSTQSRQRFLEDHFISQAKYYLLRGEIDELLSSAAPFGGSGSVSVHPELSMRVKITNVYYYFFSGIEDPFPELKEVTSKFTSFCAMTLGLSMTPSEKSKLAIFFQVQCKRINEQRFINLRQFLHVDHTDNMPFIKNFYLKNVELAGEDDVTSEVGCLYLFLSSQNLIDNCPVTLAKPFKMQLIVIKNRFQQLLTTSVLLDHTQLEEKRLARIAEQMSLNSYWMMLFDLHTTPEYYQHSDDRVNDDFPGLAMLAYQMTQEATDILELKVNHEVRTKLVYNYLMALIGVVPHEAVMDTVTVCVDFGQSKVPSNYMRKLLAFYLGGSVKFVNYLSTDTDVYLSDTFVSGIHDIPQVTWPDPLRATNWENLHQIIVDVKKKKIQTCLNHAAHVSLT